MKKLILKTKRGGASMFVVMFTVIILSIITLSFTRLIIAEATKTSNTDLSQSAYDSALAGVEDAKVALLKYHACLDQGNTRSSGTAECRSIIANMQDGIKKRDCSTVSNVLGREANSSTEQSVVVQETSSSTQAGNNTNMLQAYTCVTIKEELEDYRTTLTSQSRLRIIPLRSDDIDNLGYIRIKWFSATNKKQHNNIQFCSDPGSGLDPLLYASGHCNGGEQAPTSLITRLIQTDEKFDLSELSVSSDASSTDTGTLFFVPSLNSGVAQGSIIGSGAWGESANKADNVPTKVKCTNDPAAAWLCQVDVALPNTFRNQTKRSDSNTYLLVSLPYGAPETDVSVTAYTRAGINEDSRRDFTGVQARIDSTGRANDLYRRVETRVELVDTYFAYPEFEITMLNSSADSLNKTFYATFNCWTSNNGYGGQGAGTCVDSLEMMNYSNF